MSEAATQAASAVAGHAQATQEAFNVGELINHHITDGSEIEIPFTHLTIPLRQIHIGGVDLSITRHVVMMWIAFLVLLLLAMGAARRVKDPVPKGWRAIFEVFITYIRDEIARKSIGPNADRYLEQFRKFTTGGAPGFAVTWHWPAFLVDPFLWFLYRKMYLYALVYAVGPVLSAYLAGDYSVGIVWRFIAGASANYIYYWHVREHLAQIRAKGTLDSAAQERLLRDLGGVQPYVIWLGLALLLIVAGTPWPFLPNGRPWFRLG